MKMKPELLFGGASLIVGIIALYKMNGQGGNSVNVIPALQSPQGAYTVQPEGEAQQGMLPVPPLEDVGNQPYQTYNFGPTHVAKKQHEQSAQQQAVAQYEPVAHSHQNGGCSCNSDSCGDMPQNYQGVPTGTVGYGTFNLQTIASTPQRNQPPSNIMHSTIKQYENRRAATTFVSDTNSASDVPFPSNVPTVHSNHLAGYGI